MYFVGMAVFMIFVTRIADIYGRKWPMNISAIISIPLITGLLFTKNLPLTIGLLFVIGATVPGRQQVSFVYVCELVPVKFRTLIGSMMLLMDATTIIFCALYFLYISKHWEYYHIFSIALNIVGTLGLLLIPESPKYLHSKRNFAQAKRNLWRIARFNGIKNFTPEFKFIQELSPQEKLKTSEIHARNVS